MGKLIFFEKAMGVVAPTYALNHAHARESLIEFSSGGGSSARGRNATLGEQASSKGWMKQRKRIEAIWERRAMDERLAITPFQPISDLSNDVLRDTLQKANS